MDGTFGSNEFHGIQSSSGEVIHNNKTNLQSILASYYSQNLTSNVLLAAYLFVG
jgi:hypothetical protein